jgi:hypothetical protein
MSVTAVSGDQGWPAVGLEKHIRYVSGFIHLNINLGSEAACSAYFSKWMERYRHAMKHWTPLDTVLWCLRMRQSLKSTFISTHFALSARRAGQAGSTASFYYLSYYAVLHALWGVLYLHPDERTDTIAKPTHSKIPNVFQSAFCGRGGVIRYDVKEMMDDLRFRREYWSYRMPMNSPFEDEADMTGWTSSVGGMVKQCIQLSNLHSHIIAEASSRMGRFSAEVAPNDREAFMEAFLTLNSQRHPSRADLFLEPADAQALNEFLGIGCELYGHSVMFEHLSDQYMTYSGNGTQDQEISEEVGLLVYRALFHIR